MRRTQHVTPEARRLLDAQAGLIARAQAVGCGVGPKALARLVRDERWTATARAVFRRGIGEPTFEQQLWVGLLMAGEPAAIGGSAALHRQGIGLPPDTITVVVPAEKRRRLPLGFELLRDYRDRLDHARGSLRVIRVEDALLDLSEGASLEEFVGAVTDAVRLARTTAKKVETVLRLRDHQPRAQELLEVLADLQGIESNLEFVFRRDVLRAHGLPEGRRQAKTASGKRIDILYDEYAVVVEVDGRRGHLDGRFRAHRRDNEHAAALLTTLRYGSHDIRDDPCALAWQLARALELRGWPGGIQRCDRCPAP